jgi:hypothetical protein
MMTEPRHRRSAARRFAAVCDELGRPEQAARYRDGMLDQNAEVHMVAALEEVLQRQAKDIADLKAALFRATASAADARDGKGS